MSALRRSIGLRLRTIASQPSTASTSASASIADAAAASTCCATPRRLLSVSDTRASHWRAAWPAAAGTQVQLCIATRTGCSFQVASEKRQSTAACGPPSAARWPSPASTAPSGPSATQCTSSKRSARSAASSSGETVRETRPRSCITRRSMASAEPSSEWSRESRAGASARR